VRVACWQGDETGPAIVASLTTRKGRPPQVARIPGAPSGPLRQLASAGSSLTLEQHVRHLSEGLPYKGRWSIEEVPDRLTLQQALAWLRKKASLNQLDSGQQQGVVSGLSAPGAQTRASGPGLGESGEPGPSGEGSRTRAGTPS
jgi:hypothetical protein